MDLSAKRVRSAEKFMRPFGVVLLAANIVWDTVAKLAEHAILAWATEHLEADSTVAEVLNWAVWHPVQLFLICAAAYLILMVLILRNSEQTVPHGANAFSTPLTPLATTSGERSPAVVQGSGTQHVEIHYNSAPAARPPGPRVMAVRYGRAPGGFGEGLYLENEGEAVFEVQPEPLILPGGGGARTVTFAVINTLKKPEFSMATIEYCEGHGCVQLDPVWRKAMEEYPGFGAELPLRIVYRNYEGKWFRCVCKFERDVLVRGDAPFVVTTMRQEPL